MANPKVSVFAATYRLGGQRMMFESLAKQTFKDFEYVLGDEIFVERERELRELADRAGIRFTHVAVKSLPVTAWPFVFNRALEACRGELLVICGDYSWLSENYLERAWELHERFCGMASMCGMKLDHRTTADEYNAGTAWTAPVDIPEDRITYVTRWIDGDRGYVTDNRVTGLYTVPRELATWLNGSDEAFCGGHGYDDWDFTYRCELAGHRFVLDLAAVVHRVSHPHGATVPGFETKKRVRSNEESRAMVGLKRERLTGGEVSVQGHVGLRDERWKNKRFVISGGEASFFTKGIVGVLAPRGVRIQEQRVGTAQMVTDYMVFGVSPADVVVASPLLSNGLKVWYWWNGLDAHELGDRTWGNLPSSMFERGLEFLKDTRVRHLVVHDRLRGLLEKVGIRSEVCMPVLTDPPQCLVEMPATRAVLVYWGGTAAFLADATIEVMKQMPDVGFIVTGKCDRQLPDNAVVRGWEDNFDVNKVYNGTRAMLRLNRVDGMAVSVLEYMRLGRRVVTTYPYAGVTVVDASSSSLVGDSVAALRKVLAEEELDVQAAKHYAQYTVDSFAARFGEIMRG